MGLENTVFEQMEPLLVARVATVAAHILGVFVFVSSEFSCVSARRGNGGFEYKTALFWIPGSVSVSR